MKLRKIEWLVVLIALAALVIRVVHLGDKPLHHDESLHAYYAWQIFASNSYTYNPITHGPTLFYTIAAMQWLSGLSDAATRIGPALFGWVLVMLPWLWRKQLGERAAVAAMALLAFSPTMLYLSRFARHDDLMHVFTFGLVMALWGFISTKSSKYLWAIGALAGLAFATSETSYLLFLSLAVFTFGGALLELFRARAQRPLSEAVRALGKNFLPLLGAIGLAVVIAIVWYSSFFTSLAGLKTALPNPFDSHTGLGYWVAQHGVHRGNQPWYYYFLTLSLYEFIPLVVGIIGAFWLMLRRRTLFAGLLVWWMVSTIVIYSWAGEKFPWLTSYPLVPLIVVSAYAVGLAWEGWSMPIKRTVITLGAIAFAFTIFNAFRLSFHNPANPDEMAVYVQTTADVVKTSDLITADAKVRGKDLADVMVDGELTWPFAWYLRDASIRSYDQQLTAAPTAKYVLVSHLHEDQWKPYLQSYDSISENYQLRAWWVPPSYSEKPYTLQQLWRYFIYRTTWGEGKGSVDYSFYVRRS